MDGSTPVGHAGRPIKRGRGGGAGAGPTSAFASTRGRGAASSGSSFKRKLAGTPLFRPPDDSDAAAATSEDSGEELPELKEVFAKGKASKASTKMAKDDTLYSAGAEKARKTRFETVATENRYLQLKPLREKERRDAIASGLIPDPLKPRKLDEAITFQATCTEMCPEFEREEREYQKNVDRWEMTPGTNRIDRRRAVKAFHRPAAGNDQPLPSDVRPPEVLKSTLDYLFHDIVAQDPGLADSHPFLRDRTRAIRQDFTLQNDRGSLAIECHERIARYHILCLHVLRENENFSESQELEQLRKVLQSLNEFYEDARHEGRQCPREAEFRAYYLITHLRDSDTIRQAELLPREIFNSEHLQAALRLHSLAQRNNETRGERGRRPANSEASLNAFSRFFKAIASDETSYLLACLAETHFVDIRRGALVCLRKAYMSQHPECPLSKLTRMLGCDDTIQCAEVCENFGFAIAYDHKQLAPVPTGVILHRGATMTEHPSTTVRRTSHRIVGAKVGNATFQAVIDGQFYSSHVDITRAKRHITKKPSISRRNEKSTSPRTSLKIPAQPAIFGSKEPALATPPISVPPSPSLGYKKPPLAPTSKGLNAKAPSFSPSAFSPKPSPPTTMPLYPAPETSNLKATAPGHPGMSSQPMQKRRLSSEVPQVPPKVSSHASPSQSSRESRRTISAQPVASASTLPAGRSSVVDTLAMQLVENLLQDCLTLPVRNIAADGLGQAHAEQRAMLDSERNRVVDVCAGGLLENVLDSYGREVARGISLQFQCDRNCLRNSLDRWKRSLVKVRAAKAAKERRKRNFQALSGRLGTSSHKDASDRSVTFAASPEQTLFDLIPDPFVEEDNTSMQVDPNASMVINTANAASQRASFWLHDTLAVLICDLANKTFSTFRTAKPPDWKVVVIVPSLSGSMASWYRHKLGMQSMEDQCIDEMLYVHVEFVIVTEKDLYDEDCENVGLVVINVDNTGLSAEAADAFEKRLSAASRYRAQMLQILWTPDSVKPTPKYETCQVDTNDANAGLVQPLTKLLQQVHLNNSVGNRLSASEVASSFLEIWRSCAQTMLAAMSETCALLGRVVHTLVEALRELPGHIEPFLVLPDDTVELLPPPFDESAKSAFTDGVQEYLRDLSASSSLSMDFLILRLKQLSNSPLATASELCDGLASAVQHYLSALPVDKEATLTELQDALIWWKDTVIDQTADLLQEVVKSNASPGKKRRRISEHRAGMSNANEAASTKRIRETTEPMPPAWIPERLSSLTSLLSQARELLAEK